MGKQHHGYGHAPHSGYGHHGHHGHRYGKAPKQDKGKIAKGAHQEREASGKWAAQQSGYDNDEWAKQAYGSDSDSRWGKSYDSVAAKSYDDEQYARKIWADDDQWAEDYDRYDSRDADRYGQAASAALRQPGKVQYQVSYPKPQPRHHAW